MPFVKGIRARRRHNPHYGRNAEQRSGEPRSRRRSDRGIIVAVGTVGMNIQRKLYYEKELDFRVSRSYGPGRYDTAYEQKGRDYPIGYARWTENRNMAFLQLLADGKIDVRTLITQHSGQLMLDDGHSQSMVASLTSSASSDLIGQLSNTRLAGGRLLQPIRGRDCRSCSDYGQSSHSHLSIYSRPRIAQARSPEPEAQ